MRGVFISFSSPVYIKFLRFGITNNKCDNKYILIPSQNIKLAIFKKKVTFHGLVSHQKKDLAWNIVLYYYHEQYMYMKFILILTIYFLISTFIHTYRNLIHLYHLSSPDSHYTNQNNVRTPHYYTVDLDMGTVAFQLKKIIQNIN